MLRMGGQNVRYTLDWLKNISPELKKDCDQSILTLPTETERNAIMLSGFLIISPPPSFEAFFAKSASYFVPS